MYESNGNRDCLDVEGAVPCVIFDWAGTVLDFGSIAPVSAFMESFEIHGVPVTEAEVRLPMGAAKRDHLKEILKQPDVSVRWKTIKGCLSTDADVDAIYATFLRVDAEKSSVYSQLIAGTLETIQALRAQGIRIGSTTGYPRSIMDLLVPLAEAQGYITDCCVTVSEVDRGRPYPDMLLANVQALGIGAVHGCVAVDDSPSGLAAARAAGIWAVGIAVSGNEVGLSLEQWNALSEPAQQEARARATAKLEQAGAHYVIDTIADLLPVIADINAQLKAGARP